MDVLSDYELREILPDYDDAPRGLCGLPAQEPDSVFGRMSEPEDRLVDPDELDY